MTLVECQNAGNYKFVGEVLDRVFEFEAVFGIKWNSGVWRCAYLLMLLPGCLARGQLVNLLSLSLLAAVVNYRAYLDALRCMSMLVD